MYIGNGTVAYWGTLCSCVDVGTLCSGEEFPIPWSWAELETACEPGTDCRRDELGIDWRRGELGIPCRNGEPASPWRWAWFLMPWSCEELGTLCKRDVFEESSNCGEVGGDMFGTTWKINEINKGIQ